MMVSAKGGSVRVAEWLALPTSDHEIQGSNHAGGGIQLVTDCTAFHCVYSKDPDPGYLVMVKFKLYTSDVKGFAGMELGGGSIN